MPEFIFAVTYPVALGVYEAAKVLGVRIPEDVDIMCFGDSDVTRFITPSLSCVNQPTLELGARAVELMLSIIANPDSSADQHVIVPTDLILRETCVRERPSPRLEVG
jgi:DNA-binding LacI/PurR family transcriptional regulator